MGPGELQAASSAHGCFSGKMPLVRGGDSGAREQEVSSAGQRGITMGALEPRTAPPLQEMTFPSVPFPGEGQSLGSLNFRGRQVW